MSCLRLWNDDWQRKPQLFYRGLQVISVDPRPKTAAGKAAVVGTLHPTHDWRSRKPELQQSMRVHLMKRSPCRARKRGKLRHLRYSLCSWVTSLTYRKAQLTQLLSKNAKSSSKKMPPFWFHRRFWAIPKQNSHKAIQKLEVVVQKRRVNNPSAFSAAPS
jgi:hypothetical protein